MNSLLFTMFSTLLLTLLYFVGVCHNSCDNGIILVGGQSPSGYQLKVQLLKEDGWCQGSGFPDLPEHLENPGVAFAKGYLFVCGFFYGSPCKYTAQGKVLIERDRINLNETLKVSLNGLM